MTGLSILELAIYLAPNHPLALMSLAVALIRWGVGERSIGRRAPIAYPTAAAQRAGTPAATTPPPTKASPLPTATSRRTGGTARSSTAATRRPRIVSARTSTAS